MNVFKGLFCMMFCVSNILPASAQTLKCKCTDNTIDSFTGNRIVKTKFYSIGKTESGNSDVKIAVRRVNDTYFMFISSPLAYDCAAESTEVQFKDITGNIFTTHHVGEIDCGGSVWVGNVRSQIPPMLIVPINEEQIRKNALSMMRVSSREHYSNVILTMPMTLKTIFDCADVTFMEKL